MRATKSKEEIAEQRKVRDKIYYDKKCEKSAKRIQKVAREYITKKKETATTSADSMINTLFNGVLDKSLKNKKLEDLVNYETQLVTVCGRALEKSLTTPSFFLYFREIRKKRSH